MPYRTPAAGVWLANAFTLFLLCGVVALYMFLEVGLLPSLVAAALAWCTASALRFQLLQVPAFEVWHEGGLVYSGLDRRRPPQPEDLLTELQQQGVACEMKSRPIGQPC